MWQCTKCSEEIDEEFQLCWNCGTSKDGRENPQFKKAEEIRADELSVPLPLPSESTAIFAKASPRDKRATRGEPASEQWEYFYLSQREWSERIVAKCGSFDLKLLFTPSAWLQFQRDQEEAIETILNELGSQGWELVGLTSARGSGSIGSEAIFKRRIRAAAEPGT